MTNNATLKCLSLEIAIGGSRGRLFNKKEDPMIPQWWLNFQGSRLSHSLVSVPSIEMLLVLAVLTICLVFHLNRTGLVMAYIFTYHWGLLFGEQYFSADARLYYLFLTTYIVFGIIVVVLATLAMMVAAHAERER